MVRISVRNCDNLHGVLVNKSTRIAGTKGTVNDSLSDGNKNRLSRLDTRRLIDLEAGEPVLAGC